MKLRLSLVLCFSIVVMMAEVRGSDPLALGDKQPPKVLQQVNPVYPKDAKEQGIQGTVVLEALINEAGDVVEVKVQTDKEKTLTDKEKAPAPPDPMLAKAAIDAVKQWKYEPYRDASGKVQPVRFSVTIRFKLQ